MGTAIAALPVFAAAAQAQTSAPTVEQVTVTGTIIKAEQQIKPLLHQCGYTIGPYGTRLKTLADLTAYAQAHGLTLTPKATAAR